MNWNAILQILQERATSVGLSIFGALVLYIVGRWMISLVVEAVRRVLVKQQIEPTVMRFIGNTISVALNVTQVYFDGNMAIRDVLGDSAFPAPVYPIALSQAAGSAAVR